MEHAQVDATKLNGARPEAGRPPARELLGALSLDQKIALLTGADNFTLPGEPAIGLRGLVMSDGPAGVRGAFLDPADRSSSLPAPIALAATWNPALVEAVAGQLGAEARAKGVDVVLGPTVNIVRSPYGGRGFECFGEDPVLAGQTAAAYVRGLQSAGVAATAKHYVGNDFETERWTVDVRVDEATLRELYLVPFESCVTEADCALVMAGYNTVNGTSMTEHGDLLRRVLKDEWGFAGAVVSDWFAARSTEGTALAGLDLVMPGPQGPWGEALARAVAGGGVSQEQVDEKVLRLLRVARLVGALGGERREALRGPHADRAVLRQAAAGSFVLLRNAGEVLPLEPAASVALLGPNVFAPQYQGLGSAQVGPAVTVAPAEGLRAALGDRVGLEVHEGCRTWSSTPVPDPGLLTAPDGAGPGARLEIFGAHGETRYADVRGVPEVTWWDPLPPEVTEPGLRALTLRTAFRAGTDGPHRFAVAGLGVLRLELSGDAIGGGAVTLGASAPQTTDPVEALSRPFEIGTELNLKAGDRIEIFAHCDPREYETGFTRFKVGVAAVPDPDALFERAVAAAAGCEVAVVVVGTAEGLESEGYDRDTLALPGRQDELIAAVSAVNPRTVVVVNSGMPVLMPWADQVAGILQVWFPGQEFGHALADVLLGRAEPGGRLPVTLPRSEAACPIGPVRPVDGTLEYAEGLLIGYRGYDRAGTQPLFPFGHGLGYTTWSYEGLDVPVGPVRAGADVEVTVAVRNTGRRAGREAVQVYLSGPHDGPVPDASSGDAARPVRVLAGFTTAEAAPGELSHVRLRLPARAFARWAGGSDGQWEYPHGRYTLQVGRSSRDLRLSGPVDVG